MNPTLEVQITARLDKLDAALKVAEAKIGASAVTMGKAGEKAGNNFMASFAQNLPMMMVATAMAKTIGGGLLKAVQDVNAGKSGEDIGLGFAQGIVDGAKSLPVVGVVFGILDELVNGATRYIEKLNEAVAKGVEKYISSMEAMNKATRDFQKTSREKVEDVAVGGSPEKTARLAVARQNEKASADAQAAKEIGQQALRDLRQKQFDDDKAKMAEMQDEGISGDQNRASEGRISRDEELAQRKKTNESAMRRAAEAVAKNDRAIDDALNDYKLANQKELNKKIAEENKKAQDIKSAATEKAAADVEIAANKTKAQEIKAAAEAKAMGNEMVAIFKEEQKEKYDAAMQAQDDIIKAEQTVQKKADKAKVFSEAVSSAGQEFISSGQTALGQFNFAQQGAGSSAIDLAKKQVQSLEKIEAATAEQVRLTKENKGFL
jgi:hypothetical protein